MTNTYWYPTWTVISNNIFCKPMKIPTEYEKVNLQLRYILP